MPKKSKKKAAQTTPRATSKAASRGPAKSATKRPADALNDATAERIATALEAIAGHLSAASPAAANPRSFGSADAFVWHPDGRLSPVPRVSRVDLGLLKGIDRMRDILIENTERFADGLPANPTAQALVSAYARQISVRMPLPELPYGLEIRQVRAAPEGLSVTVSARNVLLNPVI